MEGLEDRRQRAVVLIPAHARHTAHEPQTQPHMRWIRSRCREHAGTRRARDRRHAHRAGRQPDNVGKGDMTTIAATSEFGRQTRREARSLAAHALHGRVLQLLGRRVHLLLVAAVARLCARITREHRIE